MDNDYEIEFPEMRLNVLNSLVALTNKAYQVKVWVNNDVVPPREWDEFNIVMHILLDDNQLADDIEKTLGAILKNYDELYIMNKLISGLMFILMKYGKMINAKEAVSCKEWDEIIDLAQEAVKVFKIDLKDYPEYAPKIE